MVSRVSCALDHNDIEVCPPTPLVTPTSITSDRNNITRREFFERYQGVLDRRMDGGFVDIEAHPNPRRPQFCHTRFGVRYCYPSAGMPNASAMTTIFSGAIAATAVSLGMIFA
jgi:hypothetical protein